MIALERLYGTIDKIKIVQFNFGNKWEYPHCHTLTDDKLNLAIKIANEIHQRNFDAFEKDSISWWQIGIKQGVRLVGLYNQPQNCFYPIFVDRHHLLYPSTKHNQSDFEKFKYNPVNQ